MSATSGVSLRRRLATVLLALGLLLVLVAVAALTLAFQTRADQRRLVDDYFSTYRDSHQGFVRALDIGSAASVFLRGGEPDDLTRLRALQEQPREDGVDVVVLRQRLRDAPAAQAGLDTVVADYRRWAEGLEPLVQAVAAGGTDAVPMGAVQSSEERFDVVRTSYDAYVDAVLAARERAAADLRRSTALLFVTVVVAVVTAVVAGALLFLALRRWVVVPLTSLGEEARIVRTADLEHVVKVDGPPEITALADDVEAMRRALVSQLAAGRQTQARLEQQAEDLARSNRDLEQFAYVASHDLQEPLRKVSSFCQMLERRYKGQLDDRADQYIEFAVDGAKRMQALINDLLAFSRVGRMTEGSADVALDEVLADALRNLAGRIEESGAVVTADPLPVVPGERRLLVQLMQNLIGNGLKFAGDGMPRVHVTAARRDDAWEVSVCDEGIGIEEQYAERIFVIFQRLHAKADYEGTGIGLALCKKIVEHHGGTIWLDTEAASGTVFRFTLPVEAPLRVPDDVPPQTAPAGAREDTAWTTA